MLLPAALFAGWAGEATAGKRYPEVSVTANKTMMTEGDAVNLTFTADSEVGSPGVTVRVLLTQTGDFFNSADLGIKSVIIPRASTSTTLAVRSVGDQADERSGRLTAILLGGRGHFPASGTGGIARVDVLDDDVTDVTLAVTDATAAEGDGSNVAQFNVDLSRGMHCTTTGSGTWADERIEIPLTFSGGVPGTDFSIALAAAANGVTFDSNTNTVVFSVSSTPVAAPGPGIRNATRISISATRATLELTALDDADTVSETVTVSADTASLVAGSLTGGAQVSGSAQITIADDDSASDAPSQVEATPPTLTLTRDAERVTEGGEVSFTISADPAPAHDLTVSLHAEESMGADMDFIAAGRLDTVLLSKGATSATWTFTAYSDDDPRADGMIEARIDPDAHGGYKIGEPSTATMALIDDDGTMVPVTVSLTAEKTSVAEANGEAKFTIALSRALQAGETVTAPFTVSGGRPNRHWNIRLRPEDNGPGVRRTATGLDSAVTFTEGGRVATLVLIARPDWNTAQRTIGIAFGTGDRAPRATGVAGGVAPVGDAIAVAIVDDDAAAGPVLWVEDARVRENAGTMRFTVRLTVPAEETVRVRARTRNARPVSAEANRDYEQARVNLSFRPGETRKHVRVRIFDDSHDEGRETFELVLSNARGAAIGDGVAVGTIANSDPLPAAWLSRLGRTVAEQTLDGIAGRMAVPRTPGMQGAIAGQALTFGAPAAGLAATANGAGVAAPDGDGALALADVAQAFDSHPDGFGDSGFGTGFGTGFDSPRAQSRSMTAREALLGSSFSLTGERDAHGGSIAFWGRAANGSFDGNEGTFSLDGEVTTGMLGADYARDRWLVGLALAQSAGKGDYRDTGAGPQTCPDGAKGPLCNGAVREGAGKVEASLTAAIPYASLQASERFKLWGALGYGAGEVTLKTKMGGNYPADMTWTMAAAGSRGDLLSPPAEGSGPALALTSDALWARTSSEKTRDLAASESDATRLRLGLEGGYRFAMEGGGEFMPKLEFGVRHDGGDAETGFGVELGGGVVWSDPSLGLRLELSGRTLLAHDGDDLKDRGYGASLAFDPDPATKRGPSFALRQEFGARATGGLDALFAPDPLEERNGSTPTARWTAEAAYGFPAFGGRFTGSPHMGLGLATGTRDYSVGWRLTPESRTAPDIGFGLTATRRESNTAAPEHRVGLDVRARW